MVVTVVVVVCVCVRVVVGGWVVCGAVQRQVQYLQEYPVL